MVLSPMVSSFNGISEDSSDLQNPSVLLASCNCGIFLRTRLASKYNSGNKGTDKIPRAKYLKFIVSGSQIQQTLNSIKPKTLHGTKKSNHRQHSQSQNLWQDFRNLTTKIHQLVHRVHDPAGWKN